MGIVNGISVARIDVDEFRICGIAYDMLGIVNGINVVRIDK